MAVWDRQRGEDDKLEPMLWFSRFDTYYRPLGPERNLLAAVNAWRAKDGDRGRTSSIPHAWFNAHRDWKWQERAEAWDAERRVIRLAQEQQAIVAMNERHIKVGGALQEIGAKKLKEISDRENMNEVSPTEARHMMRDGISIERKARGLPDHLLTIGQMSDDDLLREYNALIATISGSAGGDGAPGDETSGGETVDENI